MRFLPPITDPNVLVGTATADDAGVYRLTDEIALAQTVDFFTPIVDSPYDFGRIAAANAFSDIYAMGARPVIALNIVAFPKESPIEILGEILRGGAEKAAEAGVSIIGGHSIDDREPKYGMAVTGLVHPKKIVANSGARPGDRLVLTKPLGTGVVATAIKKGNPRPETVAEAVEQMAALNRAASEAMTEVGVSACTDITGFGLLGHLKEMIDASGVGAALRTAEVPFLPGVLDLAEGHMAQGSRNNLRFAEPHVSWEPAVPVPVRLLLADAQTSGGLLIAVPQANLPDLLHALEKKGVQTRSVIGEINDARGKIKIAL